MATPLFNVPISDTRIVFNNDYAVIAFYSIAKQAISNGYFLFASTAEVFIHLGLDGDTLYVEELTQAEVTNGFNLDATYSNVSGSFLHDIWNTNLELVVGTGDLRPTSGSTIITPYPLSLNTNKKGIVISSPGTDQINIYTAK